MFSENSAAFDATDSVIGGTHTTSVYNRDGLRMKHIVDVTGTPVTANYVWDVNRSVPEILQDGTNTYVYGLGRISSTDGSGNQTYYTGDGLGSTTDLTNSSAAKTDGYTYDAFGAPTHSPGSSTQPFQFTGQQTDGATGDTQMQYLRARYYDSSTGRFLSQDPLAGSTGAPSTQNRYAYAVNNPTTLNDPTGLCSTSCEGRSMTRPSTSSVPVPQSTEIVDCISHANCQIDFSSKIGALGPDGFLRFFENYWKCIDFGLVLAGIAADATGDPVLGGALFTASTAGTFTFEGPVAAGKDAGADAAAHGASTYVENAAKFYGIQNSGVIGFTQGSLNVLLGLYSGYGCAAMILGEVF